jgi:hypothetical protein
MNAYDIYQQYVGSISPSDFVKDFDGDIDAAVAALIQERWWAKEDCIPDTEIAEGVTQYVTNYIN